MVSGNSVQRSWRSRQEVRLLLRSDLNGRADEVLASALAQVTAVSPRRVNFDFGRVGHITGTGIALAALLADTRHVGRKGPRAHDRRGACTPSPTGPSSGPKTTAYT